jgi:hypothetical protein
VTPLEVHERATDTIDTVGQELAVLVRERRDVDDESLPQRPSRGSETAAQFRPALGHW